MNWDRSISTTEQYLVEVLRKSEKELSIHEIIDRIRNINPNILSGKTPHKSLYSIIYKREKQRLERGQPPLLNVTKRGGASYYSLNVDHIHIIGLKIN